MRTATATRAAHVILRRLDIPAKNNLNCLPMNAETLDFNKNEDALRRAVSGWRSRLEKIMLGGGKAAIEKQRERKKLTARERIQYLIDEGADFIEIGAFAG